MLTFFVVCKVNFNVCFSLECLFSVHAQLFCDGSWFSLYHLQNVTLPPDVATAPILNRNSEKLLTMYVFFSAILLQTWTTNLFVKHTHQLTRQNPSSRPNHIRVFLLYNSCFVSTFCNIISKRATDFNNNASVESSALTKKSAYLIAKWNSSPVVKLFYKNCNGNSLTSSAIAVARLIIFRLCNVIMNDRSGLFVVFWWNSDAKSSSTDRQ